MWTSHPPYLYLNHILRGSKPSTSYMGVKCCTCSNISTMSLIFKCLYNKILLYLENHYKL